MDGKLREIEQTPNPAVALRLLLAFLQFITSEFTSLRSVCREHISARDKLIAHHLSGENVEYYDAKVASLNCAIADVESDLNCHQTLFTSCTIRLIPLIQMFPEGVSRFTAELMFKAFGMAHRTEPLVPVEIGAQFSAHYATVRGDGACLFRAFLTAFVYKSVEIVLPNDTEGMCEWILRLKLLMCDRIRQMVEESQDFATQLMTIPENGKIRTLYEYFIEFLKPAYHGTNFDCQILADLFGIPIHVIREEASFGETHQSFLPRGVEIQEIEAGHIILIFQGAHYVPAIKIRKNEFRPAVSPLKY